MLKIGLDFDNTIVSYDKVFFEVALEKGLIPHTLEANKISVRNFLRSCDKEDEWTALQGYVYGTQMHKALPFDGVIDALIRALENTCELFIVSHKTRVPFKGPKYNLHLAAENWISNTLKFNNEPIILRKNINFREKKEEKIQRISELKCDIFIDDLPEILQHSSFPTKTNAILFDPSNHYSNNSKLEKVSSWNELIKFW